ncbi:hypothetical protein CVT24_002738 [Panaeolus cyanescens]|uniref:DDE Tnp4 domain-containing protein n=1 Tax=Panaeolus cyanescens TaxID=181874 RepID=A0A409X1R0_9AGAR|nr:hypothetical protein CVT24_002738 [Panaeolus cyanescens]
MQATVDYRARFTSFELGWPGSVQDSRIFKQSDIYINPQRYFRDHEYIIVDKGYPLTKFSIRPFNDYDLTKNPRKAAIRKKWNQALSGLRIFVEHAFGRLKAQFPWLQCLPGRNLDDIYRTIEALMVIHNILEDFEDEDSDSDSSSSTSSSSSSSTKEEDDRNDDDDALDDNVLYLQGVYRRKELVKYYKSSKYNL